ncbi:MAG: hypothetical protein JRD93_04350 [Deltaproteobacteria bacterium]|nr:hypothetical protein [Deltaproteobacteria bacterium]
MVSNTTPISQDMRKRPYWTPATIIFIALQAGVMCYLLLFSLSNSFSVRIVLALVVYMISTFLFIWVAKKEFYDLHEQLIFYFIVYFLFSIFSLKAVCVFTCPKLFWPGIYKFNTSTIAHAYFIFLAGYIPFFTGYLIWGKNRNPNINTALNSKLYEQEIDESYVVPTTSLIFICIIGISLKAFSLYFLQIGDPNVLPTRIQVPYLTGIIYFICTSGLLFLLTVLLILTAVKRRFFLFGIGLALLLIFTILDLSVGWKSPLLYFPLIIGFVTYACYRRHIKSIYRPLTIGLIALSLIGVNAYVGIQHYRYLRISGKADLSNSPNVIFSASAAENIASIITRFGGFEQLVTVLSYIESHPEFKRLGFAAMWGNEATEFYTHKLIGSSKQSKTSYSSNQWGQFYLSLGIWGVIAGMFVVGIIMRLVQKIFLDNCHMPLLRDSIVPAIFLLNRRIFSGTGEFIYLAKYILILWICFWFTRRILGDKNIHSRF